MYMYMYMPVLKVNMQHVYTGICASLIDKVTAVHYYTCIYISVHRCKGTCTGQNVHKTLHILYLRFLLLEDYLIEFNQLAMAHAEGSDAMLNRVMLKDNIGIVALLEVRDSSGMHAHAKSARPRSQRPHPLGPGVCRRETDPDSDAHE